jgi:uncharacterized protein (TIGR02231 family)
MRSILLLTLVLLARITFAQNPTKTYKATVERATVFLQGAQLTSSQKISLSTGTTDVIFEGVSPYAQPDLVQATATGEAVIMDVQYQIRYAEQAPPKPDDPARRKLERDIRMVVDSLTEIDFDRKALTQQAANLQAERQVVVSNRLMRGELQRDSLRLFAESVAFLRTRLADIDALLLKNERELYRLNNFRSEVETRRQRMQTLLNGNFDTPENAPAPIPQIIVTLFAERPLSTELAVNYYVPQAGWAASYDLRAKSTTTDIELNHKAQVWQQTGLNWKDVPLTLSTGNPNQSSIKPTLSPTYLTFFDPNYQIQRDAMAKKEVPGRLRAMPSAPLANGANSNKDQAAEVFKAEDDGVDRFTTMTENMLRVEYDINLRYTIESDGKPHNVVIQQRKLPASYNYAVVPKLDPDVFLIARVTDWESLNLIPGAARMYFDGSYVGQTNITPNSTNDTLQLNLGRDKSIVVKRVKVKDKSKEKTFGDSREVTQTFEITVRNTKNTSIRLIVEDQMPISNDADIKVEYLEYSKAKFNENTGKLTWDLKLDSRESKKLVFSYAVKMPKDRTVSNL